MSEIPAKETPVADPAAIDPTTSAHEATIDPVRPTGTDALTAESRPEVTEAPKIAATEDAILPKEDEVDESAAKAETQPVAEGVLGYKAPGLIKSLRFSKKVFWFAEDALDEKSLGGYLSSEKSEIAHPTAAYATQSGKGLLLFAKRVEDKFSPAGILNLSEASDVTKEGLTDFSFKLHGHKHTFQAGSAVERDSWLVAVNSKATDAKAAYEGVLSSDGYKKHLNKLAGPVLLAPMAVTKAVTDHSKSADGKIVTNASESEAVTAPKAEPILKSKSVDKSRSQSRKRQSIFGKVLGGMKDDDKKEAKKEEKTEVKELKREEKAEKKEEKDEAKADDAVAVETPPLDAAAVASRAVAEPIVPAEEVKSALPEASAVNTSTDVSATTAAAPKPIKRGSVFGNFFNKKENMNPTSERKEAEVAPALPAKDVEAAAPNSEPQLDPVSTTPAPIETAATETEIVPTATSAKATSPSESKGGLFGFIKQKEAQREEKKEAKREAKTEEKAAQEVGEAPVLASGTPAAPGNGIPAPTTTTTTVTTPEAAPKDKRRQSFFGTISGKKEKKIDATSDAENTDGEGKKSSGKGLGGLFRKASRSAKSPSGPVTDSSAPPAPISKENAVATEAAPAVELTPAAETNGTLEPTIAKPVESEVAHQTPVPAAA